MYTIIGSGFGLYGYLPALVRYLKESVTLPAAYRPKVLARPELSDCVDPVTWTENREAALLAADKAVVCLPPMLQAGVCDELAGIANIDTVVLEKPVAETPAKAARAYENLVSRRKRVVIDYSFLYTAWYERLKACVEARPGGPPVSVQWQFRAHHFTHDLANWKRAPEQGGGVVRFFGIHLIAVLASLDYEVAHSLVESSGSQSAARWTARVVKPEGSAIDVVLDTNTDSARFALRADGVQPGAVDIELEDPFIDTDYAPRHAGEDRRVRLIARMLQASPHDSTAQAFYRRVNFLWHAVEHRTGIS